MRTLKLFALISVFLTSNFLQLELRAKALHQYGLSQTSNYVVIGAFAVERNAKNFTNYAKRRNLNAHFELNPNRNLYYVYVMDTDDHSKAVREAIRLREYTEFVEAWVYGGILGVDRKGEDIHPETEQPMQDVVVQDDTNEVAQSESEPSIPVVESPPPVNEADDEINGKKFVFELYRAIDGEKVQGDVEVVDVERSKKIATYKGNESVRIPSPNNNTSEITFLSEVFGYRKVQHNLNYDNPQGEGITTNENGDIVIPFELIRLQKGDIAVMYNVFFFKDAAIMRPESRYEVNSLLGMLNENPKYKIRLHGHTNGNASGKVISMGESKNFFSLTDTKEGFGTAKKLSEERAELIRFYLISEGIDAKRIEVKAWGGKRPIHDKTSARAQENVRVEVEILEDK